MTSHHCNFLFSTTYLLLTLFYRIDFYVNFALLPDKIMNFRLTLQGKNLSQQFKINPILKGWCQDIFYCTPHKTFSRKTITSLSRRFLCLSIIEYGCDFAEIFAAKVRKHWVHVCRHRCREVKADFFILIWTSQKSC